MEFTFTAILKVYPGPSPWFYVLLPKQMSKDIKSLTSLERRGFGAVKVEVHLRGLIWKTSIFPDSRSQTYMLPVKKEIRRATNIDLGSSGDFSITLTGF